MLSKIYLPCQLYMSDNQELKKCDTLYIALARLGDKERMDKGYHIYGILDKKKIEDISNLTRPTINKRLSILKEYGLVRFSKDGRYLLPKENLQGGFVELSYKNEVKKIININIPYVASVYAYLKRGTGKKKYSFTKIGLAKSLSINRKTISKAIQALEDNKLIEINEVWIERRKSFYSFKLLCDKDKEGEDENKINELLKGIEEWKKQLCGEDLENATTALQLLNKIKKGR